MRNLIDMDARNEIGHIDWEFIHDMQGIVPELITPEMIYLTQEFLAKVPGKWDQIKARLSSHVKRGKTVHLAISDVENLGNDFKVRGILKDKKGNLLAFHRVVIMDKDRFEDDYLGAVITNREGEFTLSFGKQTFSDFGLEAEPDVYLKVFYWKDNGFHRLDQVMPELYEKSHIKENKTILDFGIVEI